MEQDSAQAESSFSHDFEEGATTSAAGSPTVSSAAASPRGGGGGGAGGNLRRFYGMGNAAVGGLLEFSAKYSRSLEDPYNEFDDHRFFDSRDYRCCFSLFHAKIGTFILSTLVLHEIVLGAIFLLTQLEHAGADASRLIALLLCRLLQLPPMALLYVALWRHQRWLLLPFAVSQLTIGAFVDVSTFLLIVGQLELAGAWPPFELDERWRWLNVGVPLAVDAAITVGLMWVLYRCFLFLHARRHHDRQRKADKQREREALLLRAATPRSGADEKPSPPPDEVLIVTTEMIEPRSSSGAGTSISSEQSRPGGQSQRHQFAISSARGGQLQNRHSSCQFNDFVGNLRAGGRGGGADPPLINAALSALVLNKVQGDESSGGVRSSKLPPPPPSAQLPLRWPAPTRRRLVSEMTGRPSADAEFTALMLQHRNPRSSHLRGFRGSAYSLQDYLKFHQNVEKANSATPTMAAAGLAGAGRPLSTASSAAPPADGLSSGPSCGSSNQSLTLVESPLTGQRPNATDGSDTASSSSNAIQFTVSAVAEPSGGEQTPTPQTAGFSSPFQTAGTAQTSERSPAGDRTTVPSSETGEKVSKVAELSLDAPTLNSIASPAISSADTTPIAKDQPPGPLRDEDDR